jgi:hypothetical protein
MDENKIFVVITVLSTVIVGFGLFLFWLERRISKMEKQIKEQS